jgi:hypothetical protein
MKFVKSLSILTLLFLFSGISCDSKPASSLTLSHSSEAFVVPGTASNCTDVRGGTTPYPQSVSTDFFKLTTFKLVWTGTNELVPAVIKINLEHPYIEPVECVVSGTLLEDTFGGTEFATGTIDMNDILLGDPCSIACGGITRTAGHENTAFSTTAVIEFTGYSQDTDGTNVKPVRTTSRARINFF